MHPIEAHIPSLRKFSRTLTRNGVLADDLVQESLLKALSRWQQFDGRDLRAWLLRIVRNTHISYLRKKENQSEWFDADDTDALIYSSLPDGAPISDSGSDAIFTTEILNLFAKLPRSHREVVFLIGVEGFSYDEAAKILQVPHGTVMSRLSRARHTLRLLYLQDSSN